MMGLSLTLISQGNSKEFKLVPQKKVAKKFETIQGSKVGTGWSTNENPDEAVRESAKACKSSRGNGL